MLSFMHPVVVGIMLLVVVAAVSCLGVWVVNYLKTPDPIRRIVIVFIVVLAVLFAAMIFMSIIDTRPLRP